jgi:glycosidase
MAPEPAEPHHHVELADAHATAPGEIPVPVVIERIASLRWQFRHDNLLVPPEPVPDEPVHVWATTGEAMQLLDATLYYTTDGRLPTTAVTALPMRRARVEWDYRVGYLTYWQATLPPFPEGTVVRYRLQGRRRQALPSLGDEPHIWAHDGRGMWYRRAGSKGSTVFAYRVEAPADPAAGWIRDAVIYQIFLDRFHPGTVDGRFPAGLAGNAVHGGTLRGVTAALPYLDELGVTCLWLSPFFPSPSYHRYDATDFHAVDPVLGTIADLRALTAAAHAHGMRVMIDFVPSHCSAQHPAFIAARADAAAPTAHWFTFEHWPDGYRTFLDMAPSMPSFNTDDPSARAYLLDSAAFWLRECGVDAFRLDHAIGPSMDFWVAFRDTTRRLAPSAFSVAEATDTPDELRRYTHRLDAVLDFPLATALRRTFATGEWNVGDFDAFLQGHEPYFAQGPLTISFLDNHDMNRFLLLAGNDRRKLLLATLCLFTLGSPPVVYYGTEIALQQEYSFEAIGHGGDAQARGDMVWDQQRWDHEVLACFRAVTRLRRRQAALRYGDRQTMWLSLQEGTYGYRRTLPTAPGGERDVLVAFNLSHQPRTLALPVPPAGFTATCLLSTDGATPSLSGAAASLTLAPCCGIALGYKASSTATDGAPR